MNLRDVKYIVTVADAKNFTRAAELCNVSQPTLSTQIHKVEKSLNSKIFERKGNKIVCTPVGKEIVSRARLILNEIDAMYEVAQAKNDPLEGELRLGAFPTLAPYYLPRIIPVLRERYPQLELILSEEKSHRLLEMLDEGTIDAALLSLPITNDAFEIHTIYTESFYLCVSRDNELATRESVNYNDLKNQKILLLEEGHCMREQALTICSMVSIEQRRDYQATSLETLREMVSSNLGVTLVPRIAVRKRDDIVYIPFTDSIPTRTIALVWKQKSTRHSLLKKLLQTLVSLPNQNY